MTRQVVSEPARSAPSKQLSQTCRIEIAARLPAGFNAQMLTLLHTPP